MITQNFIKDASEVSPFHICVPGTIWVLRTQQGKKQIKVLLSGNFCPSGRRQAISSVRSVLGEEI